jgi:hypothetical protein
MGSSATPQPMLLSARILTIAITTALAVGSLTACSANTHDALHSPSTTPATRIPTSPAPEPTAAQRLPSNAVAKVGPHIITKATVEHWMTVLIITDGNDIPKTNDPRRTVPIPPNYTLCVSNAKAVLANSTGPSTGALQEKCAQLRQALQEQALEILVSASQLASESAEHHITTNNNEASRRLNRLVHEEFPSRDAFRRYLHLTKQTLTDQLERIKAQILAGKLTSTLTGGSNHTPTAAQQLSLAQSSKKWIAATICRRAYAISLCNQSDGARHRPPAVNTLIQELGL